MGVKNKFLFIVLVCLFTNSYVLSIEVSALHSTRPNYSVTAYTELLASDVHLSILSIKTNQPTFISINRDTDNTNNLLLFFYVLTGCGISFTLAIVFYLQWQKNKLLLKKEKESERLLSRFFENIAHDLKTPLTLMHGPLDLLEENAINQDKRLISICKKNTQQLINLVNQLLDMARYDAGKLKLNISHINIIPFLKANLSSFKDFAESKGVILKFSSEYDSYKLYYDEEKMERIITNLLSNAIKFTRKNGVVELSIGEERRKKKDFLAIDVKDTGNGISPEDLKLIFNRYYQVSKTKDNNLEGTGIGLSLVKELVLMHRGLIEVTSKICEGTTFKVLLPKGREHFNHEEQLSLRNIGNKPVNSHTKTADYNSIKENIHKTSQQNNHKKTILVIDDHHDIRKYIIAVLGNDYEISEADNGLSGLEAVSKTKPSLIICDIMMPKMNGYDFCKELKSKADNAHIPVVIMTARNNPADRITSLEHKADAFLTKPINAHELRTVIKNLLALRKNISNEIKNSSIVLDSSSNKLSSTNKVLLESIIKIIEDRYNDEQFGVEELSEKAGMSRSQLHRKLKANINKNPNEFIRDYRLEKAYNMLKSNHGNISEIAFGVGFSSPSYFTKCFTKKYGYTPNELTQPRTF